MSDKECITINDAKTIESILKSDDSNEFTTYILKTFQIVIGNPKNQTKRLNDLDNPFDIVNKYIIFCDKSLPKCLQHNPRLLHLCAYYGARECLKLIIASSSSNSCIDTVDNKGRTPAHFAAYNGDINTLIILDETGFKLNQKDKKGKSPIYTAVKYDHLTLVNYLLLNRKSNDSNTIHNNDNDNNEFNNDEDNDNDPDTLLAQKLLHVAAESNSSLNIVNVLIENAQKIELFDSQGVSLFSKVIDNSNLEFLQIVLESFEQCIDSTGLFPIHHAAAISGNSEIIQLLIDYGADIESLTVSSTHKKVRPGETPLITACKHGSYSGVLSLLEYEPNIEAVDENGQTALHIAAAKGRVDIAEVLYDFGADTEARDYSFMTPADLAYLKNRTEMLVFFKDINVEPEFDSGTEFEFSDVYRNQKRAKSNKFTSNADTEELLYAIK